MTKRKIKMPDDYIPIDIWQEAKDFVVNIGDDITIYKSFKNFPNWKPSEEADKFCVWWDYGRFRDYPHSLILLYEKLDEIYKTIGSDDVMNGYEQLTYKLVQFYRILKENGMIDD